MSNTAYEILLERIITNKYPPGYMLNELGLHEELNISRTPIHTAMIMLQQENLVEIRPKKGIRVTDITADTIRDIYDVRTLMETYALKNFGMRFEKTKVLEYLKLFREEYAEARFEQVFQYDVQFHMDIVELTQNKIMCAYYSSLRNQFIRLSNFSGRNSEKRVNHSNQEHIDILTAILQDDIDTAVAALTSHLKKARETAYRVIILHDNTPNAT